LSNYQQKSTRRSCNNKFNALRSVKNHFISTLTSNGNYKKDPIADESKGMVTMGYDMELLRQQHKDRLKSPDEEEVIEKEK